jgi:hypothetical protein
LEYDEEDSSGVSQRVVGAVDSRRSMIRPWSMLSNTALFYHPRYRYRYAVGCGSFKPSNDPLPLKRSKAAF